jgi:hypothetical protein
MEKFQIREPGWEKIGSGTLVGTDPDRHRRRIHIIGYDYQKGKGKRGVGVVEGEEELPCTAWSPYIYLINRLYA